MLDYRKTLKTKPRDAKLWKPQQSGLCVMYVTPELAERMLHFNTRNRSISQKRVLRMAETMAAGDWDFTHQGIAFDVNGELVDGQHRLAAVALSGEAQTFIVMFGMDPESFSKIDVEGVRTARDLATIRCPDVPHIGHMTAIARAMMVGSHNHGSTVCDKNEVSKFVAWYHEIMLPFFEVIKRRVSWARPSPLIASFCNAVRGMDKWPGGHGGRKMEDVMPLARRYALQEWDGAGDPIKMLSLRLERMRSSDKPMAGSETDRQKLYRITTSAIRLGLKGESVKKVQFTDIEWGEKGDYGRRPKTIPFTGPGEDES